MIGLLRSLGAPGRFSSPRWSFLGLTPLLWSCVTSVHERFLLGSNALFLPLVCSGNRITAHSCPGSPLPAQSPLICSTTAEKALLTLHLHFYPCIMRGLGSIISRTVLQLKRTNGKDSLLFPGPVRSHSNWQQCSLPAGLEGSPILFPHHSLACQHQWQGRRSLPSRVTRGTLELGEGFSYFFETSAQDTTPEPVGFRWGQAELPKAIRALAPIHPKQAGK